MRVHDLPGHKPSEEWLNKTDLEIHKAIGREGYMLRHGHKGMIFWALNGPLMIEYLMQNYQGFRVWACCDFNVGSYGRVQGSFEHPVLIRWELTKIS